MPEAAAVCSATCSSRCVFLSDSHQNVVICCPWMCCELCAGSALLGNTASVEGEPESSTSNSFRCFISIGEMLRTVWGKRRTGIGCSGRSCCSGDGRASLPSQQSVEILMGKPSKHSPYSKSVLLWVGGGSGRLMVRKRCCKECMITLFNYTLRKAQHLLCFVPSSPLEKAASQALWSGCCVHAGSSPCWPGRSAVGRAGC